MKIKLKRFLALVAAAATALSFAGCVSNNGGTPSDDDSSDGPEIIGGENHTHSWSSAYESDAEGHWKECSGCDEKTEEAAHTFGNWQVEKAATLSAAMPNTAIRLPYLTNTCGLRHGRPTVITTGTSAKTAKK